MVKDNALSVDTTNDNFTDPAEGVDKKLRVEYTDGKGDQTGLDRFQANCKWEMSGYFIIRRESEPCEGGGVMGSGGSTSIRLFPQERRLRTPRFLPLCRGIPPICCHPSVILLNRLARFQED